MKKISHEIENPIDNIIINHIVENTHQIFRKCNATPNQITLLSLLVGVLSAYKLYQKEYALSSLLFLLAYYLDCMDGHYARTYKMTSKFGDVLDHCCDVLKIIIMLYAMYKLDPKKTYHIIMFIFIFTVAMGIHLGCQQHYYESDDDEVFLNSLKKGCKNKEWIHTTRHFGCGTFIVIFSLLILFWKHL